MGHAVEDDMVDGIQGTFFRFRGDDDLRNASCFPHPLVVQLLNDRKRRPGPCILLSPIGDRVVDVV